MRGQTVVRRSAVVWIVAVIALSLGAPAFASWAMVPLPDRLRDASAVVVGEVTDVTPGPEVGGRPHKFAVVTVKDVLKFPPGVTDASDERVKTVKVAFPSNEAKADPNTGQIQMTVASTDIAYRKGQSGVWTLTKSSAGDYYVGGTPWSLMQASEIDRVKKALADINAEPWGKASEDLAVQLLVHRGTTGKPGMPAAPVVAPGGKPIVGPRPGGVKAVEENADAEGDKAAPGEAKNPEDVSSWSVEPGLQRGTVSLTIYIKNTSKDKVLRVSNYAGDKSVTIKRTAADGSTADLDIYEFLKAVRLRAPSKDDFVELQPGEAKRFKNYSVAEFAPQGKVKLEATFAPKRDGKDLGVADVWTGSAAANAVEFDYTPEKGRGKLEPPMQRNMTR